MTTFSPESPPAILATAVVPWTADWKFDLPTFRRQVQTIARDLTRHIYIFGTAGEGHAVSDEQFREIAAAFWQVAREEDVRPMVGVISLSWSTIVERIGWARELGYRDFQISLPAWGALNDRELDLFFAETCGRFPDCRFLHYNLARAGRIIAPADYRRLIAAHPNLVSVKWSTSDAALIAEMVALAPRLRLFITERGYVEARKHGDCGLLISLASVHASRAKEFVATDHAGRERLLTEIQGIGRALKEATGGRCHIDGAFDKMLFRVSDRTFPLRLLPPYVGATEADFDAFVSALPPTWRR